MNASELLDPEVNEKIELKFGRFEKHRSLKKEKELINKTNRINLPVREKEQLETA